MGISMGNCREGTIVWVQRKNGSWWPGRIMGLSELSPSSLNSPFLNTRTPIQLLARDNRTVEWYDIEKSKRIKAFKCSEFDDCIKRAKLSKASDSVEPSKYVHRVDAILRALELEKKQQCKKRKMPEHLAEEHVGVIYRSKRSGCAYLPGGSNNCLERTSSLHKSVQVSSSSTGVDSDSYQFISAEKNSSSTSSKTCFSMDDIGEKDEAAKQHSGYSDEQPRNWNYKKHKHNDLSYHLKKNLPDLPPVDRNAADVEIQKQRAKQKVETRYLNKRYGGVPDGQSHISFGQELQDKGDSPVVDVASEHHIKSRYNRNSMDELTSTYFLSPSLRYDYFQSTGRQTRSRTMLRDVALTVQGNYRAEHVPLVCLMSKLDGKAIIGHPLEIEALEVGSTEIPLPKSDDVGHKVLGNIGTSLLQPVWRTAKRTPVCYFPTPFPSTHVKLVPVCKNESREYLKTRDNSYHSRNELLKPLKKRILSKQKTVGSPFFTQQIHGALRHGVDADDFQPANDMINQQKALPSRASCVPVKISMSKLLEAIGLQSDADHNK